LIENGIDVEEFTRQQSIHERKKELGLSDAEIVIVAVGRLSPEKGFDLLISAIDVLKQKGLKTQLLIAGSGDIQPQLQCLIEQLGLSDQVRLLGHVSDPRQLYEAADLVVLSSHREGLPNVLLEAMALEVPVVATRVNGVPRLVQDGVNGLLVSPGSVDELASAIGRLAGNLHDRQHLAIAGRETVVKKFSFAARMDKIRAIYDRVLNRV
jgi:glycosyltransferase involved in cell wall biosynthesis